MLFWYLLNERSIREDDLNKAYQIRNVFSLLKESESLRKGDFVEHIESVPL